MSVAVTPHFLSIRPGGGYSLDPSLLPPVEPVEAMTDLGAGLWSYKDPFGHVFMSGEAFGVAPGVIAVLPASHCPGQIHAFVVECSASGWATVYVDPAGNVVYSGGPALSPFQEIDLSACHWRAGG